VNTASASVLPGAAVVTGASSGIGAAIARILAAKKKRLVLVARSAATLDAEAADWRRVFGGEIDVLPLDLVRPGAPAELFSRTEGRGLVVDLLVNAAGFGWNGPQREMDVERLRDLLRLNVLATAELTHLFLGAMAARGKGKILNVASTAGFYPTPYFSAYGASKAFLLAFTHALHEEAKRDGVTVTALCPGYTRTNFHAVAGMKEAGTTPFPEMTAEAVAEEGLRALEAGKAVAVTHPLDRAWIAAGRLVPRSVPAKLGAFFFSRTRR
jgi:short-subunit dehydrogenase